MIFWAIHTQHHSRSCCCITYHFLDNMHSKQELIMSLWCCCITHYILGSMHSALELIMSLYHMIFLAICTQHQSWLCRCITWYSGQYALSTGADYVAVSHDILGNMHSALELIMSLYHDIHGNMHSALELILTHITYDILGNMHSAPELIMSLYHILMA